MIGRDRQRQIETYSISDWHPCGQVCDVLSVPLANQVYRLPPLPPTPPGLEDLSMQWLEGGVLDAFSNSFWVGFDLGFVDGFEAAGVTFCSILGSIWEAVAPCGHLSGPLGTGVTENSNFCEK